MAVSLRQFSQSSLIDDIDVEILRARFVLYDFEGKSEGGEKTCLLLVLKDNDGNEHPSYFSAGSPEYFVPSEDPKNDDLNGITVVPVGDKQLINGSTNCAMLINSLIQAGFPEDRLDSGDVRELEGLKGHVNRVAQPKRNNLPKREGQKNDPTVLVFTSIISLPGESKPAAGAKAAAGKAQAKPVSGKPAGTTTVASAKASPSSNGSGTLDDDLLMELAGEVIGLFAAKEVTSMKRVDITKGLFGSIDKTNPKKNKIIQVAGQEAYLKALDGFSFDGSVLSQE